MTTTPGPAARTIGAASAQSTINRLKLSDPSKNHRKMLRQHLVMLLKNPNRWPALEEDAPFLAYELKRQGFVDAQGTLTAKGQDLQAALTKP